MKNEWLFGFSTNIEERIKILSHKKKDTSDLTHYNNWRQRKTLLSETDFDNLLQNRKLDKYQFNNGIAPLGKNDLKELFEFVKKQEWFLLHKELFHFPVDSTGNLDTALRFHYAYFQSRMERMLQQFPTISFNSDALDDIRDGVMNDFMQIANKALVWDVHELKERAGISEPTPEKEFYTYLQLRLSNAYKTQQFFLEYPTLAKLLAIRLKFAIENFSLFLNALDETAHEITNIFGIRQPFHITEYKMGKGDSHQQGKSTIILKINDSKLVFKCRDNQIGSGFNQLLSWIETLDPSFHFYKLRHFHSPNYTFEEFVSHESCQSEHDIRDYYTNYGHLLAITYWLNSTDLHMENLIAHGNLPVLIDVETLLMQEDKRVYEHKLTKKKIMERSSIIKSGLLPLKNYWKQQLEISALTGSRQKLTFKVRKLTNEKTSEIKYQLEDGYLEGAKNIPLLLGKEIIHHNYISFIEKGFIKMNQSLLHHKNAFIKHFKDYFSQCNFRVLLRDTQDYQDFISFAVHPTCMTDYVEREKVFENLWFCPFEDRGVILMEIENLLVNDVPLFTTNCSSCDLSDSMKIKENFFKETALSFSLKHIKNISPQSISESLLLLKESLGNLSMDLTTIMIPERNQNISNALLAKAADIGDLILQKISFNKQHNHFIWTQLQEDGDKNVSLEYPSSNLYDGTAGLFLFFHYLNYFVPKKSYQDVLESMEHEVFSQETSTEPHTSAFYNDGCQLTVAILAYHVTKSKKFLHHLNNILHKLETKKLNEETEWLHGSSSLIAILCFLHEITDIPDYLSLIEQLSSNIKINHMNYIGFAHGYSGILYSLTRANKLLHDIGIIEKIKKLKEYMHCNLDGKFQKIGTSWCHGVLGISKATPELEKLININTLELDNDNQRLKKPYNSCICHGMYGDFENIIHLYLEGLIDYSDYSYRANHLIQNPIHLMVGENIIPLGLFTGLSGIGYQILRCASPSNVPSILFFE